MSQSQHSDEPAGAKPAPAPSAGPPRRVSAVGIALVVVVIVAFVLLHLAGALGPGAH